MHTANGPEAPNLKAGKLDMHHSITASQHHSHQTGYYSAPISPEPSNPNVAEPKSKLFGSSALSWRNVSKSKSFSTSVVVSGSANSSPKPCLYQHC